MKKSWRWVRNILLTVAGLAVVLALVGYSYQVIQTHLDARRFPMKGTLIDVGGHKLNINCTGEGAPTVVLETGLENLAMSWEKVQLGIEKFTRGCVYDRAGYGWSEAGPLPRTSLQIAKELHQLLRNSGEKPRSSLTSRARPSCTPSFSLPRRNRNRPTTSRCSL
jgi:hypothetical protein